MSTTISQPLTFSNDTLVEELIDYIECNFGTMMLRDLMMKKIRGVSMAELIQEYGDLVFREMVDELSILSSVPVKNLLHDFHHFR